MNINDMTPAQLEDALADAHAAGASDARITALENRIDELHN